MKHRRVLVLLWLCTVALMLCSLPETCSADAFSDADGGNLTACQAFVLDGETLYIQSEDGVWRRDLANRKEERLFSFSDLKQGEEISGDFSLFIWNHTLALADWETGKLLRWTGSAFELLTTLQNADAIDTHYIITVASQGDHLWILCNGALRVCDILTGNVSNVPVSGLYEIAAHPEGGIVAVRIVGAAFSVVRIPSPTALPETLAPLTGSADGGLACDAATGTVYAVVSGSLSRLDDGKWTALTPLSRSLLWRNCAVCSDQFLYLFDNKLYSVPMTSTGNRVQLTIRGVNIPAEEDQFFLNENPSVTILRQTTGHYCAEEIYQAITTGDTQTDLFFVAMSSGVRSLMQKGYLQSVSSSALLQQDNTGLYSFASDSCRYDGELFAVPEYLMLGTWCVKNEYQTQTPPATLESLIAFARRWDEDDGSVPAVADAFCSLPWSRKEYVLYALRQYLLLHEESDADFNDPALRACLERCGEMGEAVPLDDAYVDTAYNGVITANDYNALSGDAASECTLISPPALGEGIPVAIPATLYVYVVNPRSAHPAEAIAYLEFLSQNRSDTATAQLDQDATATPFSASIQFVTQLDAEIEQAKAALNDCQPEERKSFEDALNHLLLEKEQEETSDLRWAIHPAALQRYQKLYAPNINLQLTPLLEDGSTSHAALWSRLADCLAPWLDGQSDLSQCLASLNALYSGYIREQ